MKNIKLFEDFLNESQRYYCGTCGDRAELSKIDEDPDKKCSNCGDSDWVPEYETNEVHVAELEDAPKIKFKKWTGIIDKGEYKNGRISLSLVNPKNGEYIAVASVNVPDEKLAKDEVIIKTYGENDGILEPLIQAGIISKPVRTVKAGYETVPVCKILI